MKKENKIIAGVMAAVLSLSASTMFNIGSAKSEKSETSASEKLKNDRKDLQQIGQRNSSVPGDRERSAVLQERIREAEGPQLTEP